MTGAVAFHGVWKKYLRGERHDTLRDLIPATVRRLLGGSKRKTTGREAFWALQEVSFEVGPGQALGVIGPNGAGKSTILKLASGILRADRGKVEVRGRIGALIELVAGFHSELTGRENIYVQGAVMGMKRAEIDRRFEEIVEFSGVAQFLDTPVKRYSSGMNTRLGFSIAAHMDADVLLIDEVLSVGDVAFQQRALERMREIMRREIPVVVVSHQLDKILDLCDRAILLTEGRVVAQGSAAECVAAYVGESAGITVPGDCPVRITEISEPVPADVAPGERLSVTIHGAVSDPAGAGDASVGVRVRAVGAENIVFATNTIASGLALPPRGAFALQVELAMNVAPGLYRVQAVVWHYGRKSEWARGPSSMVRVTRRGDAFVHGPVFLDPRLRLLGDG